MSKAIIDKLVQVNTTSASSFRTGIIGLLDPTSSYDNPVALGSLTLMWLNTGTVKPEDAPDSKLANSTVAHTDGKNYPRGRIVPAIRVSSADYAYIIGQGRSKFLQLATLGVLLYPDA